MTIGPELEMALAAFVAVMAAQLLKGLARAITSFVKGTPTSIDDKVWAAVQDAVYEAVGTRDAEQKNQVEQVLLQRLQDHDRAVADSQSQKSKPTTIGA